METIKHCPMISRMSARPGIFTQTVRLDVIADQNEHVNISITNVEGKIVRIYSWKLSEGSNWITLPDLQNLKTGIYKVNIADDSGLVVDRIEITKL